MEVKIMYCEYCGEVFNPQLVGRKLYCSFDCARRANNQKSVKAYRRRNKGSVGKPRQYTHCVWCGGEMPELRAKDAKTCCDTCRNKYKVDQKNRREHPERYSIVDGYIWTVGIDLGGTTVDVHPGERQVAPEIWLEGLGVGAGKWPALVQGVV